MVNLMCTALRDRRDLVVENLLLRHQLAVLTRSGRRPRLRAWDRLLWILVQQFVRDWRRHLVVVQPRAVISWHRQAWKLLWRWKSRTALGRPRLSQEVRELIAIMSRDNPLWGTERIRGELAKLGLAVSNRSIRRYRWRGPVRSPSQTWRTFLANHRRQIWAADLFTVHTLTFRTLYVLFFIAHGRRELVHFNITAHPTAAWVWRQLIEATPWGRKPHYLIRDRDRVYGGDFVQRAKALRIQTLLTPVRAPQANAIAERMVQTCRTECLDHLIVINERHLQRLLSEFVAYYNTERPHRTLAMDTPYEHPKVRAGPVSSRAILGGLHHVYSRAA